MAAMWRRHIQIIFLIKSAVFLLLELLKFVSKYSIDNWQMSMGSENDSV